MKYHFFPIVTLSLLLAAAAATASHVERFSTDLSGSEEVPPVSTSSSGNFRLQAMADGSSAKFRLRVNDGQDITAAHLHCGVDGQNGPVVAHLFGNIPGGFDVDGELAEFTIHNTNIVTNDCSPAITNVTQLTQAAQDGRIYVNVHSVAHPEGEIRGQLMMR